MSGGGKGGSQTTKVEIPAWLEQAAQRNIARAEDLATLGYTPYYGPDVAALTPMQEAAMANTNAAASAFGLGAAPTTGAPTPQQYAGGVSGYSSGSLYDQAVAELQGRLPGQYAGLTAPFRNPVTGAMPAAPYAPYSATQAAQPATAFGAAMQAAGGGGGGGGGGGYTGGGGGGGTGSYGLPNPSTGRVTSVGGYTSIRDMFDGGGPGQSGSTFSGGPFSGTLNAIGVSPRGAKK